MVLYVEKSTNRRFYPLEKGRCVEHDSLAYSSYVKAYLFQVLAEPWQVSIQKLRIYLRILDYHEPKHAYATSDTYGDQGAMTKA